MDEGWRDRAACKGVNPAVFFPERGATDQLDVAFSYCTRCEVTEQCDAYAELMKERSGIWGGKTARLRVRERGKRRGVRERVWD